MQVAGELSAAIVQPDREARAAAVARAVARALRLLFAQIRLLRVDSANARIHLLGRMVQVRMRGHL